MKINSDYHILRELLIDKILNCNSSLKHSKSTLNKKNSEELVNLLYQNAIDAEKELWREDIIKRIVEFKPNTESTYKNSGTNLLTYLIKVVKEQTVKN